MKIVFMGTPDFAKCSLEAIYSAGHEILAVVTNPDKPSGRGMKLTASPVKQYAQEKKLLIYQPQKIRTNQEFIDSIKNLNPDVICVVAYGKILPQQILDIPKKGCINVHGSLLPKYRGAAPIQWAVINGEKTTGVTTMYMDAGMDTGDMIFKEEMQIGEDETTGEVWDKLAEKGAKLLVKTLEAIENGTAPRIKQGNDFTMAPMLEKENSKINFKQMTAVQIKNLVRGLNPIMGAYAYLDDKKIKIWKAQVLSEETLQSMNLQYNKNAEEGTILISDSKKGLYVQAKEGILKILEIQGENSRKMPVEDYLRGNKLEVGKILN